MPKPSLSPHTYVVGVQADGERCVRASVIADVHGDTVEVLFMRPLPAERFRQFTADVTAALERACQGHAV